MTARIVLACSGGVRASAAIGWLRERYRADVIAVTVDVGQERDLEEIRERALALGAVRAHVLDRRDAFAAAAIDILRGAPTAHEMSPAAIESVAPPVIAAALAEVAAIERATAIAHAAVGGPLAERLAALAPLTVVPGPEHWSDDGVDPGRDPIVWARAHGVPLPAPTARWSASRHLLCRPVATVPESFESAVDVTFAAGVPVAVTGVAFARAELVESLSLLGGRHGIGRLTGASGDIEAPAAVLLHAAFRALSESGSFYDDAVVRLTLHAGSCTAATVDRAVVNG